MGGITLKPRSAGRALSATAPTLSHTIRIAEALLGRGEDRVAVLSLSDRLLVAVADGAGGVVGGAAAADAVCRALDACAAGAPTDWTAWLAEVDGAMAASRTCGLAAAVAIEIRDDGTILGASAGDCEAWLFADGAARCLTAGQIRKPLLGDGARPVALAGRVDGGTLVVATDGLWKYAGRDRVAAAMPIRPLGAAADALIDAARLRSGALQDDIAVFICDRAGAGDADP